MKKGEKIIIIFILLVSVFFIIFNRLNSKDKVMVSVKDANENTILTFNINEDNYYTLQGNYGVFNIEVKDGRCRAIDVECPNQICVHTGWISVDNPVPIICLPNGLIVSIDE